MVDEAVGAEDGDSREPLVSFNGSVSLGNVLILLGMIGTGMIGIYTVGVQVRGVQDAIAHETDLRTVGEKTTSDKLADVQRQEARDISTINQSIISIRDDVRVLTQASTSHR